MASRKTSPAKPSKPVARPRPANAIVKDLRAGIEDLQAIDPEHPWAVLLKEAVAAIREEQRTLAGAVAAIREQHTSHLRENTQLTKVASDCQVGLSQVWGGLEQVKAHLVRFIDSDTRARHRDERIEEQLAAINRALKEKTRGDRVVHHGKLTTGEALSREVDRIEQEAAERYETYVASTRDLEGEIGELQRALSQINAKQIRKEREICDLRNELARLGAELVAARTPNPPPIGEITIVPPPPPFIRQFETY